MGDACGGCSEDNPPGEEPLGAHGAQLRQMATLRILIADDHPLMLRSVRQALECAGDIEVVGEATRGSQVLPLITRTRPDVALLDVRMPDLDGFGCLERIRAKHPEVAVVLLTAFPAPDYVASARIAGARGYIVKSVSPMDLVDAIRQIVSAPAFQAFGLETRDERPGSLTDRELSIVTAVARGLSNKEIARELWITEQTVKFHLGNVYRKLEVVNRTEAARVILERGLGLGAPERERALAVPDSAVLPR